MKPLNIVFAGTPDFAAQHLQALLNSDHNVIAVYTQPDKPAGRGQKLQSSAVKIMAQSANITVYQPRSLKSVEAQNQLLSLQADVIVVVAYGLILPSIILNGPRLGCLNVHASLLPRWRGAAPIQRAIWAGDSQTGITIMQMDVGLDTGDMLYKTSCEISATETSESLYAKLLEIGPDALIHVLNQLETGKISAQPQDEQQTCYAEKLSKAEAKLDWHMSADQLARCIRAFNPWPVSYLTLQDEQNVWQTVKIYHAQVLPAVNQPPGTIISANKNGIQIATIDGVLNLLSLQPAGKKPMSAQQFLNGRKHWFPVNKVLL